MQCAFKDSRGRLKAENGTGMFLRQLLRLQPRFCVGHQLVEMPMVP